MWFGFTTTTVDVIRPASVTERGDTIEDWDSPTEHTETGWLVQPLDTSEQLGLRDAIVRRFRALVPVTADVLDTDRVRYAGRVYEIDGGIQPWPVPPGSLAHNEIVLKRVEG